MKLTKKHLFLILLLAVIFCCGLGVSSVVEGMENEQNIKVGSTVIITVGSDKHVGTVSIINDDGTYEILSYQGRGYSKITKDNVKIATSEEISDYVKKMTDAKDRKEEYSPQISIDGNKYSTFNGYADSSELSKSISLNDGRIIYATPQNTVNGIPGKQIPPGQEDLYILKSQVVPPVCPACPTIINKCQGNEKCPPCPPCGRCPEPSFECIKRPTYKPDNPYLPMPVLADFSSFGM